MLRKLAAAALIVAFAASPVLAQPASSSKPAAAKTTKAKAKRTCYDLAWDSQAQKDCLAKGTTPTSDKPAKSMKKAKKTS
jgi:uncharacterized membrane protein